MSNAKVKIGEGLTTCSLSRAKEAIWELFHAEKHGKERQVPFLLGPPGQGKTSIVYDFTKELNQERDEKFDAVLKDGGSKEDASKEVRDIIEWVCLSFRLAQCDPTDLKGVPIYKEIGGLEFCSYAPPNSFPIVGYPESAEGKNVVLFLDEVPQAPPTIQNLSANIIDSVVGDHRIDFNRSFIMAAGNRGIDRAATYDTPRNVINRVTKFDVKTTFKEWEEWAINAKVNPMVIGYLKEKQSYFNEPPPEETHVYGTPRSWHKLSCQMNSMGDRWFGENSVARIMAGGTVGQASAAAFYQFAKTVRSTYNLNDILAGKKIAVPSKNETDILFSLCLEAAYRINEWVSEAINTPQYSLKQINATSDRADQLINILGRDKVDAINNVYTWIDSSGIDPAFQVLINKYQTRDTIDNLRPALMLNKAFGPALKAYDKISGRLTCMS